jgi:hypothetical protein
VCTFFYPYKDTRLYKICQERGLLKDKPEMLEITNYNTRPSIIMSAGQEKDCIKYQRRILNYLLRHAEITEISGLPLGLRKLTKIILHLVKSALRYAPVLDRAIRNSYADFRQKAVEAGYAPGWG